MSPADSTGFVTDPRYLGHDTGPGHPERPSRLTAITERLGASGLTDSLDVIAPRLATVEELTSVHPRTHVDDVEAACARGPVAIDGDTCVGEASWTAARLAAGGALEAAERVLDGRWRNAFCGVRPPGHHAERGRAMGFCLFNNVAVVAQQLIDAHGLERVAVLDWDVHHGNGTQHIFEESESVFYASLHQFPLYPGTGARAERGLGAGDGTTLNCPLAAGTRDADWIRAIEDDVLPALDDFRPQFVLLSAGFDAHRADPLAGVELSEDAYRVMTTRMLELAERHAEGRLVSVLEGGYHLEALAASVEAHVETLTEGGRS